MAAVYEHEVLVTSKSIDSQGHANNLEYLRWMQDAAVAHSAHQGWPMSRYRRESCGWVVRSHRIQYWKAAFDGDRLIVRTWISDFRKVRSLRKYKILRPFDNAILATGETDWTFIDLKTRAPRRVPDTVARAFTPWDESAEQGEPSAET